MLVLYVLMTDLPAYLPSPAPAGTPAVRPSIPPPIHPFINNMTTINELMKSLWVLSSGMLFNHFVNEA